MGGPFYGGTYYPKESRYGMPSFQQLMVAVHDAYRNKRDQLEAQADNLHQALKRDVLGIGRADDSGLTLEMLDEAAAKLMDAMDPVNGGFGTQPKFPNPISLEFSAAILRPYPRRPGAAVGDADAAQDGRGRHLRPSRRRLRAL